MSSQVTIQMSINIGYRCLLDLIKKYPEFNIRYKETISETHAPDDRGYTTMTWKMYFTFQNEHDAVQFKLMEPEACLDVVEFQPGELTWNL
jgi:hypothetical protein